MITDARDLSKNLICALIYTVFEIRPFRLSETTKICGGQSIVTMRLSARTTTLCEGYFHITLLFKGMYKSSVRDANFDYNGELPLVD